LSAKQDSNKLLIAEMRSGGPGAEKARTRLIENNAAMVYPIARKIDGHGMTMDEMIAEGMVGLITAIDRIARDQTIESWSSYVYKTVYFAILMYVSRKANDITLSDHIVRKVGKWRKATYELYRTLHREPTDEEICEFMGISHEEFGRIKLAVEPTLPLFSSPMDDRESEETTATTQIADDRNPTHDQICTSIALKQAMDDIYEALSDEEVFVLTRQFGLENKSELTPKQIAAELGCTVDHVHSIQTSYSKRLRTGKLGAALREVVAAL